MNLLAHARFWMVHETPAPARPADLASRSVAVIIPARDEAAVIGESVASLLAQDFPGQLRIFLIDDHSTDGTASAAGPSPLLTVIVAPPLEPGWTGKLWAMSQGVAAAEPEHFDYYLFTDADIVHSPSNIGDLVVRAEAGRFDIVSLMVELSQESLAERALVPAFVFFFFMLYPPEAGTGAAGGCLLIRPEILRSAGGLARIKGDLIDDCALARIVRSAGGRIWLGPTRRTRSIRRYETLPEIGRMISRSAYTQLHYSPWLLIGSLIGMAVAFLSPLAILFAGLFLPTLMFYGRSPLWALALPVIALFYMGATVDSAIRHWQGRGGEWKGRTKA